MRAVKLLVLLCLVSLAGCKMLSQDAPAMRVLGAVNWNSSDDEIARNVRQGRSLCVHPSKNEVAVGCDDRVIRIINTNAWAISKVLEGHQFPVTQVAWSPDGTILASADSEGLRPEETGRHTVRLWDAATGKLIRIVASYERRIQGVPRNTNSLAFSPDGRLLFWTRTESPFGSNQTLTAYSLKSEQLIEVPMPTGREGEQGYPCLPIETASGLQLSAGGSLWRVSVDPELRIQHLRPLRASALNLKYRISYDIHWDASSLGYWMLSNNTDVVVRSVDSDNVLEKWRLSRVPASGFELAVSPNSANLLLSGSYFPEPLVVNAKNGKSIGRGEVAGYPAVFSADGSRIYGINFSQLVAWQTPEKGSQGSGTGKIPFH